LFLQSLALIQQVADVLSDAAHLLAELVLVDAREFAQQALVLLECGLSFRHLTLKDLNCLLALQRIPGGQ
jgi:hypothetical protein